MRDRTVLSSKSGYPYKAARIIPGDFDITKTWYISFYPWDVTKDKLIRRRVLKDELKRLHDLDSRLKHANQWCQEISEALADDYHLESKAILSAL